MNHRSAVKRLVALSLASIFAVLSTHAAASGFQLFESNAVNSGDAGSGGAAIAEDASTAYDNPAGLVRLKSPQLVLSGANVLARSSFSGTSVWSLNSSPSSTSYPDAGVSTANLYALVPAFHYAQPINPNIVFGVSFVVPFGLATNYAQGAFTRYANTLSEINVYDLSPSVGFKINDKLSLGLGIDIERFTANLDSMAGLPGLYGSSYDSMSRNELADWGYGWHAGMLYQFTPSTRLGFNYHSQVALHPQGNSTLSGPLAGGGTATSNGLRTDVKLPPTSTLSLYHALNDRVAVMGSVNYTQWSTIQNYTLRNVQSLPTSATPQITVVVPQNFHNTWRYAVGTNYKLSPTMLLRAGVGYDQSPTNNTDRTIGLPDINHMYASLGAHYQATKMVGLDIGYTHVFLKDINISNTKLSGSTSVAVNGIVKASANVIGIQATWNLG